jgi:hypothetical protein
MALIKVQSEGINLADDFTFGGTVAGAGESNVPFLRAFRNSLFNFSANTNTTVIFNAVTFDSASAFNTSTGIYTIPAGQSGKYFLHTCTRFNNASMNNEVALYFIVDGVERSFSNKTVGGNYSTAEHCAMLLLNAGSNVLVRIYTNTASPQLDGSSSGIATNFQLFKVSST